MQLHPGDVGWFWRFGPEATAAALRVWRRNGRILAIGLLDGPVLRLTFAPDVLRDESLAKSVLQDISQRVLEVPAGARLKELLSENGWTRGEAWTPLRRDLRTPVEDPCMRIEVVAASQVHARTTVQRAAFDNSTFTVERWHAMAAGSAYSDARCLLAYDDHGTAVAAVTVWSAGPGKPGLLEPLGVHREHRGHGYGKAVSIAAAAALQQLGSSSAIVCTPSANVAAVATYVSAGFQPLAELHDHSRAKLLSYA